MSEAIWCIEQGDCLEVLKQLPDACVEAVVTDPPAGIAFMGKAWDRMKRDSMTELQAFQEFIREVFVEVYRVLKPGGHAVVWALPRTSHHTAMGMERAGFDIRDNGTYLFHVFGSGFPKSHNLDGEWEGWGTALKPAVEFWILARKPLDGTVAENVLAHGTGALNIDGCRIGDFQNKTPSGVDRRNAALAEAGYRPAPYQQGPKVPDTPPGRWPAHLLLDEGAAALLDEQSGIVSGTPKSYAPQTRLTENAENGGLFNVGKRRGGGQIGDVGGPSRFFYVPKASKRDKDEGLDDLPERSAGEKTDREDGSAGITAYAGSRGPSKNIHPTVKPTELMRYLCRLVTPPGGVVLDPFMGSGSTGKAAILEGFSFIGIERESEYVEIARARLAHADANKEGSDE